MADCVILLDHRVDTQMATRRLRIVKYRGSTHGTSEYPFLIDEGGVSDRTCGVDGTRGLYTNGYKHSRRVLHLLKSRGMAHSNQVREFLLTDRGVQLQPAYVGPSGALLTGTARVVQEAQEKAEDLARAQEIENKKRELKRGRKAMEAQIATLRAEFEAEQAQALKTIEQHKTRAGEIKNDPVRPNSTSR